MFRLCVLRHLPAVSTNRNNTKLCVYLINVRCNGLSLTRSPSFLPLRLVLRRLKTNKWCITLHYMWFKADSKVWVRSRSGTIHSVFKCICSWPHRSWAVIRSVDWPTGCGTERHCLSLQWHSRILHSAHTVYYVVSIGIIIIITAFMCCHMYARLPSLTPWIRLQSTAFTSGSTNNISSSVHQTGIPTLQSYGFIATHLCVSTARYGLDLNVYFSINSDCERLWRIYRPACQQGDPGSVRDQSMWGLWWTEDQWDRLSSQYFRFPPSAPFRQHSMLLLTEGQTGEA